MDSRLTNYIQCDLHEETKNALINWTPQSYDILFCISDDDDFHTELDKIYYQQLFTIYTQKCSEMDWYSKIHESKLSGLSLEELKEYEFYYEICQHTVISFETPQTQYCSPKQYTYWYKNGKIHRDGDQPAIQTDDMNIWCKNGEIHRDGDKPAMIALGDELWYCKNGMLFREHDKPSVCGYGYCAWSIDGKVASIKRGNNITHCIPPLDPISQLRELRNANNVYNGTFCSGFY